MISDLKVLKSAAGFYIGRIYTSPDGYVEPYDRCSGYFATEDGAAELLYIIKSDEERLDDELAQQDRMLDDMYAVWNS